MIKTKNLLFLFCMLLSGVTALNAQNNTVSSGGDGSGAGGSVSYSIGQTDYITESGTGGTITQGLQQPYEILVITGIEVTDINLSASVYPNPTAEFVTLHVQDVAAENMNYILCDVQGKIIRKEKVINNETTISMIELSKATYLIRILNDNKEVKTFKIVKN